MLIPLDVDDLVCRYQAGQRVENIASDVGASPETVRRRLRARGVLRSPVEAIRHRFATDPGAVEQARAAQRLGVKLIRRDDIASADVVAGYLAGDSLGVLAARHATCDPVIARILTENGVPLRNMSEAGLLRASRETPETRRKRAAAVSARQRGRRHGPAERAVRARANERREDIIGEGEEQLTAWLLERGLQARRQAAVGPYNVDLLLDRLAVEVHLNAHYPLSRPRLVKRLEYLRNAGLDVLYVWVTRAVPLGESVTDQVVAYLEVSRRNESSRGQHWVVRGDGQRAVRLKKGRPSPHLDAQ